MNKKKKLTRNKKDRLIAGVLGGVADYFSVDSTVVRIVWLITLGLTGFIPGIIVYLVALVLVPEKGSKNGSLLQSIVKEPTINKRR